VSLWGDSNLRSKNISHLNELQLFDLPSIRCAVGILQCEFSYDWSSKGWPIKIFMEPEDSRLLSMQEMWLHYTLCVSEETP
jgi:hypothetical protein